VASARVSDELRRATTLVAHRTRDGSIDQEDEAVATLANRALASFSVPLETLRNVRKRLLVEEHGQRTSTFAHVQATTRAATIHSSKGREFSNSAVVVADATALTFDTGGWRGGDRSMMDRNLLLVAVTRASGGAVILPELCIRALVR
jgi:hypothetical protein